MQQRVVAERAGFEPTVRLPAQRLPRRRQFRAVGLAIFRDAFETVGLPPFNPHSFRHSLANLGERLCKTPEEFKAWSQNLGHEQVLTTFTSYGELSRYRQAEIIKALGIPRPGDAELQELTKILTELRGISRP